MNYFLRYLATFRVGSIYLHTLAVDVLTWLVIGGGVWFAIQQLQEATVELTAGKTAETFQSYLLSLPPEQLAAFSGQLKAFVVQFIAWLVLVPILVLVVYALSRAVLWHVLNKKDFSHVHSLKWVGITLLLLVLLAAYAAVNVLLRWLIVSVFPYTIAGVFVQIAFACVLVGFLVLKFLACKRFIETHKIWQSIGDAFGQLKHHAFVFVSGVITLILLQLVQYPLRDFYFIYQAQGLVVQGLLFLVFVNWMRLFICKSHTF